MQIAIIPKSLTSHFAQDTKVSDLELSEQGSILEQSLTWRGKHSLSRTWLTRLKRGGWIKPLSSLMYVLSPGNHSLHTWVKESCHSDFHVNPFPLQVKEKQQKTTVGSSTLLQMELPFLNQESSSQKTSKDCSQQKCQTEACASNILSRDWKQWVTQLRQDYSVRKKSVRHTEGRESLSWPTTSTVQDSDKATKKMRVDHQNNLTAVVFDSQKVWLTPTVTQMERTLEGMEKRVAYRKSIGRKYVEGCLQEQVKNWPTPTVTEGHNTACQSQFKRNTPPLGTAVIISGHQDQTKTNTSGKNQESWATPMVGEAHLTVKSQKVADQRKSEGKINLTRQASVGGKLNPAWVEHLMGLPVGWTHFDCLETE